MTLALVKVHVAIDLLDTEGYPFRFKNGDPSSWEIHTVKTGDEYKALLGDQQSRVSIGVDEKIGGPHYSSCSVRVNITLTCNQDEKTLLTAARKAYELGATLVDEHIGTSMGMLLSHIKENVK